MARSNSRTSLFAIVALMLCALATLALAQPRRGGNGGGGGGANRPPPNQPARGSGGDEQRPPPPPADAPSGDQGQPDQPPPPPRGENRPDQNQQDREQNPDSQRRNGSDGNRPARRGDGNRQGQGNRPSPDELFDRADANGDGALTRDEFRQFL